jgi:hypothetical protein
MQPSVVSSSRLVYRTAVSSLALRASASRFAQGGRQMTPMQLEVEDSSRLAWRASASGLRKQQGSVEKGEPQSLQPPSTSRASIYGC